MKIRKYHPNDYNDILEISKHIWEGNDYLPHLINEFYESQYCEPYVVEEDGTVVSIVNMNKFTKNFAWLEAMRTHPNYRSRGIATQLNEYLLQEAKKDDIKEVWLSTSQANEATAKMLVKTGFEEIILLKLWDNDFDTQNQQNNGLIDGTLKDISYLSQYLTEDSIKLEKSWRPAKSKLELRQILSQKESEGQKFIHLVNEFNIFPLDSYFVDSWIQKSFIFINDATSSIMTFKPGAEKENAYIVGIYDLDKDIIASALSFAYNHVKQQSLNNEISNSKIDIKLFYPFSVDLKLLDSSWVFRIMKKEIL